MDKNQKIDKQEAVIRDGIIRSRAMLKVIREMARKVANGSYPYGQDHTPLKKWATELESRLF